MKDDKNIVEVSTIGITKSSIDNYVRDEPEKVITLDQCYNFLEELSEKSKCYDQLTKKFKDLESEKDKLLEELERKSVTIDQLKKKLEDSEAEKDKVSDDLVWKSMCYEQLKRHFARFNKTKK